MFCRFHAGISRLSIVRLSFRSSGLAGVALLLALCFGEVRAQVPAPDQQTLMREVTQLRTELRQQQDLVLLLRSRLAEAEAGKAWVPWLVLGLGASLVLAGWLALRGRRAERPAPARHSTLPPVGGGEDDAAGPATVFAPPLPGLLNQDSSTALTQISTQVMAAPSKAVGSAGAASSAVPPVAAQEGALTPLPSFASNTSAEARLDAVLNPMHVANPPTPNRLSERPRLADAPTPNAPLTSGLAPGIAAGAPMAAPMAAPPQPPRPAPSFIGTPELPLRPHEMTVAGQAIRAVSVEELFDLEQQVDFFLVLGQTESAVDLLVSHIRGTGGNSALPYLKLMEVYRQQGDAESYERTRKRFNQRFNAHAPEWSVHLQAGRTLEEYPEVIARLVRVWPVPLDALAELEALMFRRTRGELFDLPAFRDVLLLHAMAVDLHERSPMSASKVDILLPLGEEVVGNTSPSPHMLSMPAALATEPTRTLESQWGGLDELPATPVASTSPPIPAAPRPEHAPRIGLTQDDMAPAGRVSDFVLDLDLSEFAPAPKDYTRPAAFTDLRRGEPPGLVKPAANDWPDIKPAKPSF